LIIVPGPLKRLHAKVRPWGCNRIGNIVTHEPRHGDDESRLWQSADGIHIDVRGLNPPEPMLAILALLEKDDVSSLIAHLDREPLFLYPELDERGWAYELLPPECGDQSCTHDVRLRLVRLHP
jgi:hypothetical protein